MIPSQVKEFLKKCSKVFATRSNYKFILRDWLSLKDLDTMSKVLKTKRFSQNLDTIVMPKPKAHRTLVIAPHPDDDVFCCGGTMIKLLHDGCRIKVIYLTSGTADTYKDKKEEVLSNLAERIEEESKEAAKDLGTDIEFWRNSTRNLKIDGESIDRLKSIYNELQPDVIFLPFIADDHDDHRRSVQLFYESFRDLKDLNFEIWAYQAYSTVIPNVAVDITDQIDEKIRLVDFWKSRQVSRDWPHYIRGQDIFNSRFLKTSQPRYAELFFVVPGREYVELCSIYFEGPKSNLYYCESYRQK